MQKKNLIIKNGLEGKMLSMLSIFIFAYWTISRNINVYQTKLGGAIFEILWLPMLALLFIIPFIAIYFWKKEKYALKSMNFLALSVILILILTFIFS